VVIAAALTVLVTGVLLLSTDVRPKTTMVLLGLVQTLPVAGRRRCPLLTTAMSMGAYVALNAIFRGPYPPDIAVIPAAVTVYSVASYTAGRRAVAAGVLTFFAVEAAWIVTPQGNFADFLPWILWGGPWGVGRLARRRTLAVSALGAQTALLEERRTVDAQDAAMRERDRIARELHDVVAHAVSVIAIQAGSERLALQAGHTAAPQTALALEQIERTARDALTELRTMLGVLRQQVDVEQAGDEPGLVPQPDLDAIPRLVQQLVGSGLPIRLETDGAPHAPNAAVTLAAYRIVQESLTNVVKHSGAATTTVRLGYAPTQLTVEISNGRPSVDHVALAHGTGYGLIGMRERARILGGCLDAAPTSDGGWRVTAELPFHRSAVVERI
jgi:signal transduction histidine kinase